MMMYDSFIRRWFRRQTVRRNEQKLQLEVDKLKAWVAEIRRRVGIDDQS